MCMTKSGGGPSPWVTRSGDSPCYSCEHQCFMDELAEAELRAGEEVAVATPKEETPALKISPTKVKVPPKKTSPKKTPAQVAKILNPGAHNSPLKKRGQTRCHEPVGEACRHLQADALLQIQTRSQGWNWKSDSSYDAAECGMASIFREVSEPSFWPIGPISCSRLCSKGR